ncbi:MAG: EF-hand domain-containing protein [Candidatus Marinarcus sp.]|uniref:EF-hand domain-containing protein n=1 Tax=Candidatus Marinarcus sp. TaxID=3100987 RepID=UPI003AFFD6AC
MKNLFKTIKLGFLVAGSLSVITSSVMAQDLPSRGPISFSIYDSNNDGFVTEKEFYDVRAKRMEEKANAGMPMRNAGNAPDFTVFDTNSDGKLSEIELLRGQNAQMMKNKANMGKGMGQGMGKGMGQQGMGQRANMPTFESFDANNDGSITPAELDHARATRMEQKASQGKMMKNAGNQPAFADIDTNNDGVISKDEFLANQMRKK